MDYKIGPRNEGEEYSLTIYPNGQIETRSTLSKESSVYSEFEGLVQKLITLKIIKMNGGRLDIRFVAENGVLK